ncbi:hypothetical protein SLEP1_g12727 [Rubroshorea leprosula]|uniref:Uncharacterized protein n=1 Tax=Rubroshorea leprosula TaxID=152421 RepID=A0AAV5IJA9_9ROSI|nr:hypothetical protein SLEP1_g12727 [Rubroshorea leprosula]
MEINWLPVLCKLPFNASGSLALLTASPRHSPAVALAHVSPVTRCTFSVRSIEPKHQTVCRSGPQGYSSSRKVKLIEGSNSGAPVPVCYLDLQSQGLDQYPKSRRQVSTLHQ